MKKLTINHCHELAYKKEGQFLDDKYINSRTKYKWKCKFNHIFSASYDNVKQGKWCAKCAGLKKLTIEHCKKEAKNRGGICLSNKYVNCKTKMKFMCKNKHQWETTINDVKSGYWCPECVNKKRKTVHDCVRLASNNNGLFLSKKYKNAHIKYKWGCKLGHIFTQSYNSVQQGTWCPKCRSKTQTKIFKYCQKLFPNYHIKYNFKGFNWLKTNKGRMELDIYIPELKLAIEYDGEQHFQPIKWSSKTTDQEAKNKLISQQKRDKLKNELIKKSEEVDKLIRFNYQEEINFENVKNKILQANIVI